MDASSLLSMATALRTRGVPVPVLLESGMITGAQNNPIARMDELTGPIAIHLDRIRDIRDREPGTTQGRIR